MHPKPYLFRLYSEISAGKVELLINGKVPIPAVIIQDRNVVIYNSVIFAAVQPDSDDFCDLPEDLALTIQRRLSHLDDNKLIVNL